MAAIHCVVAGGYQPLHEKRTHKQRRGGLVSSPQMPALDAPTFHSIRWFTTSTSKRNSSTCKSGWCQKTRFAVYKGPHIGTCNTKYSSSGMSSTRERERFPSCSAPLVGCMVPANEASFRSAKVCFTWANTCMAWIKLEMWYQDSNPGNGLQGPDSI